jgi:acyl-CoA thioester hydrolase
VAGVAIYRTGIAADWIDYNGHLRDAYYGLIVSYATDALMERIGLDASYRERSGCTLYTLEMHIHYLREVKSSDTAVVNVRVLGADHKRIHAAFDLGIEPAASDAASDEPAATAEVMLLHVQQQPTLASRPFPPSISAAIEALMRASGAADATALGSRRMQLPQR